MYSRGRFTHTVIILWYVVTFLLLLFSSSAESQVCFHPDPNIIPVSPYQSGLGNSFLYFSGDSTQAIGPHLRAAEFISSDPNYKIELSFRVKINGGGTIISQYYNVYGWFIAFDADDMNKLKFFITDSNVYNMHKFEIPLSQPPYTSDWINLRIMYDKSVSVLKTYENGVLAHSYPGVSWHYNPAMESAFCIGALNAKAMYGINDFTSYNFFRGSIDDLLIKIKDTNYININFNWGAGKFAVDSASFFKFDRRAPYDTVSNVFALTLGNNVCETRYDPEWVNTTQTQSNFSTLGTGFDYWRETGLIEPLNSWQANSTVFQGSLYVTGLHDRINGTKTYPGDTSYAVSRWDSISSKWVRAGSGLNGYGLFTGTWIDHFGVQKLVVTGVFDRFHTAGSSAVNNIGLWDGSNWSALTDPGTGNSGLTNGAAAAMGFIACELNHDLVVGGIFSQAGSVSAINVARWKYDSVFSVYHWSQMSSGLGSPGYEAVYALAVFNGELYAGGNFMTAGSRTVRGLAKWNELYQIWDSVDNSSFETGRTIQVLHVFDNKLWVGGSFLYLNSVRCNNIGYFDGISWHNISDGGSETGIGGASVFSTGGEVTDMASVSNNLFICGSFEKVNGRICNKLARYDKVSWCSLGYGVDLRPEGLNLFGDKLVITGDMYSADGIAMNNIALYDISALVPIGIQNNSTPVKFSLHQNYPNPFNPVTTINYELPAGSMARLEVYNILGQHVAVLLNEFVPAGKHERQFDGLNLPSGVYFYKLTAGEYSDVKKMVLLK